MDQRTKNRIREHSSHWIRVEHRKHVFCLNGPGWHMKCRQPCNWFGWIHADAIEEK